MQSKRTIDLRKRRVGGEQTLFSKLPLVGGSSGRSGSTRKSPLRTRRRRMRVLMTLFALTLGGGIVWLGGEITYLPQFSIQQVEVVGADETSKKLVRAYVETELDNGSRPFLSSRSIFFYPARALEAGIQEYFPRIQSVTISRDSFLAQTVRVTIAERNTEARWCGNTACYLLDSAGFIFAEEATSTPSTALYTFTGVFPPDAAPLGQKFLPEHLGGVLAFLQELGTAGFAAERVSIENEQDFSVLLKRGFVIRVPLEEDLSQIVRNLDVVLSSDTLRRREGELEYIDLRFGNRVYYKFRGAAEQSE